MNIESTAAAHNIRRIVPETSSASGALNRASPSIPFSRVLERHLVHTDALKFSAHARRRLASRSIVLSKQDLAQLVRAVDKAAAKGSRDSLVLLKDLAFVVNVSHRTVVTAIDGGSMRENIFTNIDSAVLA